MKPHWYHITIIECPACGRGETIRERRYTPKPERPQERYSYQQSYNWCLG